MREQLTMTERLAWVKIPEGRSPKKPAAWGHGRDDVDRKTGRPTWKQLTFSREIDEYTQTVTVKATGEVIVNKGERLSEKGKRKRQDGLP